MNDCERLHVVAKICRRFIIKDGRDGIIVKKVNQILKNVEALNLSLSCKLTFYVDKFDFRKNELAFTELLGVLPASAVDLKLQKKITPAECVEFTKKVNDYLFKISHEAPYELARTIAVKYLGDQDYLANLVSDRENPYPVRMEAIKLITNAEFLAKVVVDRTESHDLRVLAAKTIRDKSILANLLGEEQDVQILAAVHEQLKNAS